MSPRPTSQAALSDSAPWRINQHPDTLQLGLSRGCAVWLVTRLTHAYSIGRCFMVKIGWIYDRWPTLGVRSRVDVVMSRIISLLSRSDEVFFLETAHIDQRLTASKENGLVSIQLRGKRFG